MPVKEPALTNSCCILSCVVCGSALNTFCCSVRSNVFKVCSRWEYTKMPKLEVDLEVRLNLVDNDEDVAE